MSLEYRELNFTNNGEKLSVEGTHTFDEESRYGVQSLALSTDVNNVPDGVLADAINVSNGGHLNTQWTVPNSPFSIEYKCLLSTGVTESRVLTYDGTNTKYYVDGIPSTPVPMLPTGVIRLNNIAAIGFSEQVDKVHSHFKVYSVVVVP